MYDKDYFINSSISNYVNYNEKKYDGLANDLIKNLGIEKDDKIVDFGCATGLLIKEFVERGFKKIKGTDISDRAIECGVNNFGLKDHLEKYYPELLKNEKDYVFILDVLEHMPTVEEIIKVLSYARENLKKGIVVRIPVSKVEGEPFFLEVSRNDKTHVQCHSKEWWEGLFKINGYKMEEIYYDNIYSSDGVLSAILRNE